jgi:hypothetical protein
MMFESVKKNHPFALLSALLIAALFLASPAAAQDEPTPTADPAQEEPTAEPETPAEPAVAAIPVVYRQKTLITIKGKTQEKGVVELVVQPQGGEPTKVRVNVLAKTKPKKLTEDLLKEIDFAVDERYEVKRAGDVKIRVKAKKKNPPIAITITVQSLSGASVTVSNG